MINWTCKTCNKQNLTSMRGGNCSDSYPCQKCGDYERENRYVKGSLINGYCFTCSFWINLIRKSNNNLDNSVRINGDHYQIGPEEPFTSPSIRGYGGRLFIIRYNTGVEVKTTNLWHQGKIPERFLDQLPDNATFVNMKYDKEKDVFLICI